MSYILDALRKAEAQRQRGQPGQPSLLPATIAASNHESRGLVTGLAAALALSLLLVTVLWWRGSAGSGAAVADHDGSKPTLAAPNLAPPAAALPAQPIATPVPVLVLAPSMQAAPNPSEPSAASPSTGTAASMPQSLASSSPPIAAMPLTQPSSQSMPPSANAALPTAPAAPRWQDLDPSLRQQVPAITVQMHAYADKPSDRLVSLNNTPMREGDSLPSGLRVEAITPEGVVLSHQGLRFLRTLP